MPKSKAASLIPACLFGLIFPLVGCAAPKAEPVFVDLDGILAGERPEVAGSPSIPKPPAPAPAVEQGIPAHPEQALRDPSRASPGSLKASLERQQKEALSTLERRLRDYYRLQADAFELEQNRDRDISEAALYAEANNRIRLIFEEYADQRAPRVARLAVLVGFPDPNPTSIPPKNPLRPVAQQMFDEAKKLREELRQIDDDFMAAVDDILAEVVTRGVAKKEDVLARVRQFRDEMNRRAEQEAAAEVRTSIKELGLHLTEPSPVVVPGTAAKTVRIPAEAPLPPAPQVPSVGIPRGLADRKRLLQHELSIWLGLNRYQLAARGTRGTRDATKDFQAWRETYRAGL